jgi:hypothetical protein
MKLFQIAFLFLLFVSELKAADICQYFLSVPIDNGRCQMPGLNTVTGGGFPTFSDAFNINPASIPVVSTPLGLEGTVSKDSSGSFNDMNSNFAIIKGFDRFGSGISTNSDSTFFTTNIIQIIEGGTTKEQKEEFKKQLDRRPTYNIGSALAIPTFNLKNKTTPTAGYSFKYNRLSKKWDGVWGGSINSEVISFGYSYTVENASAVFVGSSTGAINLSIKIPYIRFELSRLIFKSTVINSTTDILTINLKLKNLLDTAAMRSYKNYLTIQVREYFGSFQYRLNRHLAIGAMINYVPNTVSFGAQFFL